MSSSFAFEVVAWPSSPCARYFTTPRSPAGKMSVRPRPRRRPISAVQRPTPRNEVRREIASSSHERREALLREIAGGERAAESPGSRPPSSAKGESAAGAAATRRRAARARETRCRSRPRSGRGAPYARHSSAPDVVGELEVDLLGEDRSHERLPQRRDARDAEPAERADRRAENRVGSDASGRSPPRPSRRRANDRRPGGLPVPRPQNLPSPLRAARRARPGKPARAARPRGAHRALRPEGAAGTRGRRSDPPPRETGCSARPSGASE